jgi:RNA polymerase sigma-70 factor (ECF subfamily)
MAPMTEIWQLHKDRLRGYIARRVRDEAAVDDILQEVFLKAHQGLDTLRSQASLTAWLFRLTANAIADHYRTGKPWEELPESLASAVPERDYRAELASCLQPLIDDLPRPYREALVLSELEGLPHREVAARLGLSLSGAKSRVLRGREKLRRRLLDCCHIETGSGGIIGYEPRDKNCCRDRG